MTTYSVGFGGLSFDDSSTSYRLVTATPAAIKWRRTEQTAPFVAGSQVLSEVQDVSQYRLDIRCVGSGGTNARTLANALKTASAALPGSLVVVLAGASETYVARPADITVTAAFEDLANNMCTVSLSFPVQPYPS